MCHAFTAGFFSLLDRCEQQHWANCGALQAPIRGWEGWDGNVNGAGQTKCGTQDDMEIYSEKRILTLNT